MTRERKVLTNGGFGTSIALKGRCSRKSLPATRPTMTLCRTPHTTVTPTDIWSAVCQVHDTGLFSQLYILSPAK